MAQASNELPLKRRFFIRRVISYENKGLSSTSKPVTEFLFEQDLPQVITELILTNKLDSRLINKYNRFRNNKETPLEITKDITNKTLF